MKTVEMFRDFDCRLTPACTRAFKAGGIYPRQPEAAVAAILKAGAGCVVGAGATEQETTAAIAPRANLRGV